jgi:hypothetical protein
MPQATTDVRERIVNAAERADRVRPYFDVAQREGLLRADITVAGAVEFLVPDHLLDDRPPPPR